MTQNLELIMHKLLYLQLKKKKQSLTYQSSSASCLSLFLHFPAMLQHREKLFLNESGTALGCILTDLRFAAAFQLHLLLFDERSFISI